MKVEQIYELMNTVTEELLGDSIVVEEDLSGHADSFCGGLRCSICVKMLRQATFSDKAHPLMKGKDIPYLERWPPSFLSIPDTSQ